MKRKGKRLIFVSGGARSGKSAFVENWAKKMGIIFYLSQLQKE